MTNRPRGRSRHGRLITWMVSAGLAAAAAGVLGLAVSAQVHPPAPAAWAAGRIAPSVPGPRPTGRPARPEPAALPASPPAELSIPAIGVHSGLSQLKLNADGSLQVPASYTKAGWYDRSATPGQPGPAIVAGHVDSYAGPGVFFRLGALRPGDMVLLRRADGRTVRYVITGVRQYAKDRFPTLAVYGPTRLPTIRLITCGGTFDRASGHYLANVIAFGQLAGAPS